MLNKRSNKTMTYVLQLETHNKAKNNELIKPQGTS